MLLKLRHLKETFVILLEIKNSNYGKRYYASDPGVRGRRSGGSPGPVVLGDHQPRVGYFIYLK